MSVVKINVLEVPEGRGEMLEQRFAARAGEVEQMDGFESFELLRPTDGTDRYLVVTHWRDEAAFEAWLGSESFSRGHAQSSPQAAGDPHGGQPHGGEQRPAGGGPAAVGSELWGFVVVASATSAGARGR